MNLSNERIVAWCLLCQISSDEYASPDKWEELEVWLEAHGAARHDSTPFPHYVATSETWHRQAAVLSPPMPGYKRDDMDELVDELAFVDAWGFGVPVGSSVTVRSCEPRCHIPGSATVLAFHRVRSDKENGAEARALVWRGAGEMVDSVVRDHLTPST